MNARRSLFLLTRPLFQGDHLGSMQSQPSSSSRSHATAFSNLLSSEIKTGSYTRSVSVTLRYLLILKLLCTRFGREHYKVFTMHFHREFSLADILNSGIQHGAESTLFFNSKIQMLLFFLGIKLCHPGVKGVTLAM